VRETRKCVFFPLLETTTKSITDATLEFGVGGPAAQIAEIQHELVTLRNMVTHLQGSFVQTIGQMQSEISHTIGQMLSEISHTIGGVQGQIGQLEGQVQDLAAVMT
jgi:hypothetical protein